MAPTHVISSALGFAVAAPLLNATGVITLSPSEYLAGVVVCGGAGLLPDIDTIHSRASRSFGFISQGVAMCASWLFGGHRKLSHTLWFALAVMVAVAYQRILFAPVGWFFAFLGGALPDAVGQRFTDWSHAFETGEGGVFLMTWYLSTMFFLCANIPIISGMAKSRRVGGFAILPVIFGGLIAWWALGTEPSGGFEGFGYWLPWAVMFGCVFHCLGDMCTTGLVPFFMTPIRGIGKNFRIGIPFLGNTSSARETMLCFAMGIAILPVMYWGFNRMGGLESLHVPFS